jgi:asparagine synthase (glutamine-hydrolysing)
MVNPEGSIIIVFNGEIYNAFDFRDELIAKGYQFRSRTDTEVLLYLYQEYGVEGMLKRINGMFAIVICDLAQKRIHLIRDRVGIKPLYFYTKDNLILFASEIKSFYAHPEFEPVLESANLDEYFLFRYCASDRQLLKGVRSVPPASILTITADGYSLDKYWEFAENKPLQSANGSVVDQLESALRSSVQRQLQSDVELGCQLSGGIDSSLVAMMAAEEAGDDLHAISIIFRDAGFSEERYVDQVSDRYQINSHKYHLDEQFFLDHLTKATWHLDQPLNHLNSIGIFLLAKHAKEWMTVLLSGEGADELLGGYSRYAFAHGQYRSVARLVSPLVSKLPNTISSKFEARFGRNPHLSREDWFISSTSYVSPHLLHRLKPEADIESTLDLRRVLFDSSGDDFVKNCMKYDLRTYLVDLLIRQDKMTMAYSVENRVPFLDNEILDLWSTIPSTSLVKPAVIRESFATKLPLKQIAEKYFGRDFAYRRKMGFGIPIRSFLSSQPFKEMMEDLILPGIRSRGIISANAFEAWWRQFPSFGPVEAESFWIFVAFELWCHVFLDGNWVKQKPSLSTG